MKLHVLTAVTRPRNLNRILGSLRAWGDADFIWHIRFDEEQQHVGGQAVKNAMLDSISDGWVWFLDDDTIAHPAFYARVREASGFASAVVVDQLRADGRILTASPQNVQVNEIDIGQAVIRRDRIGSHRIPEEYAGDGYFLEVVLDRPNTVFLNETLSFHNRLERR